MNIQKSIQPKPRFVGVDLMRGLAMILVIVTHTAAYFMSNKAISSFWNIIHFSVPVLVFCSGYVLFAKYNTINSTQEYFIFLKKRLIRLLKPFYIFLLFLFIVKIFENRFNILQLWQGVRILYPDISWLVLLFVQLTILFPLCLYIIRRPITVRISLILLSCLGILLIFWRPSIDYRWYMGLPWLLPFVISRFYQRTLEKQIVYKIVITTFFAFLFIVQYLYLHHIGHDLILQNNKYPPNLYYLSYALAWLFGITILVDMAWVQKLFTKPLSFFSMNSFSLYFIHFLLIEILSFHRFPHFTFFTFTTLVLGGSILVQMGLNSLLLNIKKRELILRNR
jgi:peptidoglycan/LPS O-acetylase OafA/YrhL